jgi:hypothetical protein
MEKVAKKVWVKPMINNLSIKHITLNGTVNSQGEANANPNANPTTPSAMWKPGTAS